jgi:hypothetical protein
VVAAVVVARVGALAIQILFPAPARPIGTVYPYIEFGLK